MSRFNFFELFSGFRSFLKPRKVRDAVQNPKSARRTKRVSPVERLEERMLLAYTAGIVGNTVAFTGDGASDTLILSNSGGLLQHNLPVDAGGCIAAAAFPCYESSTDLDSATAGVQSRTVASITFLAVFAGGGTDLVQVNALGGPLGGALNILGEGGTDTITIASALNLGSGANTGNLLLDAETINLNNATVSTDGGTAAGDAFFFGAVMLGTGVTIDTNGAGTDGEVAFSGAGSTIDGGQTLAISAGGGNVDFDDNVGATTALTSVTINNANNVTFSGTLRTTGNVLQSAGAGTTTFDGTSGTGIGGTVSVTTDAITFNAGSVFSTVGAVTLNAQNAITQNVFSSISSVASTVSILANQDGVGGQDFLQDQASVLTSNQTVNAISVSVGGVAGGGADARIYALSAGSTTGRVTVTVAGGRIVDEFNDAAAEIGAAEAVLTAANGIGSAANPFDVDVDRLDVRNTTSGGIFVTSTAGLLTLTDLNAANGAVSGVGGGGEIRANSPLTIAADATTSGGMTYLATDSAAVGVDNLTVNGGVTVRDTTSSLTMNGGDNVVFSVGSTVRAFTSLTINGDFGNADFQSGTTMNLFGTIRSDTAGITINGDSDDDSITIDDNGAAAGGTVDGVVTPVGITVNGFGSSGGSGDSLTLQDFSDTDADTFRIAPSTISVDPPGPAETNNFFDGLAEGVGLTYFFLEVINIQTSSIASPTGANGDTVVSSALNPGTIYNVDANAPTTVGLGGPGDRLILNPPGSITAYEQGGIYAFEFPGGLGAGTLNATEFETIELMPGNGILNIVGDEGQGTNDGGAGVDEADQVVVTGTGVNAGVLRLAHGGSLISQPPFVIFSGVSFLNINTFDLDDTVTVMAYADNTPAGWGIDVRYDGGLPTASDNLIYNGVSGVAEDIRVLPSGVGAGQVAVTNAASGTPIVIIDYVANEDIIVNANTGAAGDTDRLTIFGTNGVTSLTSGNDTVTLRPNAAGADASPKATISDGGTALVEIENYTNIDTLYFDLLSGTDSLIVNHAAGAVNGLVINYEGGLGFDTLTLQNGTATADTYTPGPIPGNGRSVYTIGGNTQTVNFTGLEPVIDTLAGPLVVNADDGANAISYTQGSVAANGRVAVDNQEGIEFSNKSTLTINAGGGSDEINLNNPTRPTGLTGDCDAAVAEVQSICVNAGDPGASDRLIVNSPPDADGDNFRHEPTATGAGVVINDDGNQPQVRFIGLEQLEFVMDLDEDDEIRVCGTLGNDRWEYFQGLVSGSGTIRGTMNGDVALGGFILTETSFRGVNFFDADADINIGLFGFCNAVGGADSFTYDATSANDILDVVPGDDGGVSFRNVVDGQIMGLVEAQVIDHAIVRGHEGDDTFNHSGAVPFPIFYEGGDPSGSDVLNLIGAPGVDETVTIRPDLTNPTQQDVLGLAAAVDVSGVELIAYTGVDGDDDLIVETGPGNDSARVEIADILANIDRVLSSSLPEIQFSGLDVFQLDQVFGLDTVTFALQILGGAASYEVNSTGGDSVIVEGEDGGFAGGDTFTVTDPAVGFFSVTSSDGPNKTLTEVGNGFSRLELRTLGGDDTVIVDNSGSGGLISNPITYDGGTGVDRLRVESDLSATTVVYTPGIDPSSGRLDYDSGTMTIDFTALEPIVDLVVATTLTVNGTNADNAINYSDIGGNGLVSVDSFETIEFANKGTLVLNGLAGDDTINLNNPNTPAGLTAITVDGGDPTGSDTLIVNGIAGSVDDFIVSPTATGSGIVTSIVGPLPVTFSGTEHLTMVGQSADADSLRHNLTLGDDTLEITVGATVDSGSITGFQIGAGGFDFTPVSFTGFRNFLEVSQTVLGGTDTLIVNGTNFDDTIDFVTSPPFLVLAVVVTSAGTSHSPIFFSAAGDITTVVLRGLAGDDSFNMGPLAAYTGAFRVEGGDPSASDVLNFNGSGVGNVTVTLGGAVSTIQEAGFGLVSISGVERAIVSAAGANASVIGTDLDEAITYTPDTTTDDAGTVTKAGLNTVFDLQSVAALDINAAGGSDTLAVVATTAGEVIDVDGATVDVNGLLPVDHTNFEALEVYGGTGSDTFIVTGAAIPIFIDGGDPIGVLPGDLLIVTNAIGFFAGPEVDEGGYFTLGGGVVSFDHIESHIVTANGPCAFLIVGTGGDDDITVIARDDSYIIPPAPVPAGLDGVQDFTVQVNGGGEILFIDEPDLFIDAGAGDDDIVIRAPAPNDIDWDVNVRVAGGPPSIGESNDADRLVLETPGFDSIVFNPSGPDTGDLVVDEDGDLVYTAASTDSIVTFGSFTFVCDEPRGGPIEFTYNSSPGGVELVEYDGELVNNNGPTATDDITINGTAVNDTTTVSPTAGGPGGVGTGSFVSNSSPLFNFRGFDAITVNGGAGGFDVLGVLGTEGPDTVAVAGTVVTLVGTVNIGAGIDRLDISTFGSNDSVTVMGLVIPSVIDVGSGNDSVSGDAATTGAMTIFGRDGNDSILGGNANDSIYGGFGDDTMIGAVGNDQLFGEEGNDRFGDALTTGNGVADDPGADVFQGGDGIDQAIWEPGDGSDLFQGGDDGADILRFFGADAVADAFTLAAAAGAPTHFNITLGAATVDTHGVEQINVTGRTGGDTFAIADLSPTEVEHVLVDVTAGDTDLVLVNGRDADDNLLVSTEGGGQVNVLGLEYDVRLLNVASGAGGDTLTVNGNDGDDVIKSVTGVEAQVNISLSGGAGNDFLSADATLSGDAGNDTLVGGVGADLYDGGAGDDLLVVSGGTDTMVGGTEFDIILYQGTEAGQTLNLDQVGTIITVSGLITGTIEVGSADLERIDINAEGGDDAVGTLTGLTLPVVVDAGAGNDSVSGSATVTGTMTIFGRDGNDSILGGNSNDSIYGGFGDDTMIGAVGNDQLFGEAGNDRFGDALTTGNGVADDPGADVFQGGDGIDQAIWEPGDGSDLFQGGDDGADILRFFGADAVADAFTLAAAAGAPTHFNITLGAATVDTHGVEQINVTGRTGDDTFTIADLTTTEIEHVLVDVTAGDADSVIVNGRDLNDDVLISTEGAGLVNVLGLEYDVRLLNVAAGVGSDTLTVNGNDGDDVIKAVPGVEAVVNISLSGGQGNDFLSADATLDGGASNDTLIGGADDDTINGGAGDDVIDGRGGINTIDGGADEDTLLVSGTAGDDVIGVNETPVNTFTVTGGISAGTQVTTNVEAVLVQAGAGSDAISVTVLAGTTVDYTVDGESSDTAGGDSLTLALPTGATSVTPGSDDNSGLIDTPAAGDVAFVSVEAVTLNASAVAGDALTMFGTHDDDTIATGNVGGADRVWVNSRTVVTFSSFETLNLDGRFGDDRFSVSPVGMSPVLTAINVIGGDPTASDTLTISASVAAEAITYSPSGLDAGTVTITGSAPVAFTSTEGLIIDGRSNFTGDALTVDTFGIDGTQVLTPGSTFDSGTVDFRDGGFAFVTAPALRFEGLGSGGSLTFTDIGRFDNLIYRGTSGSDTFGVDAAGVVTLNTQVLVNTPAIITLTLDGLEGDDTFTIAGDHNLPSIRVEGGDPDASDELIFLGSGGAVTVALGGQVSTITEVNPVTISGVEHAIVSAAGANVSVIGTDLDESITYTPDSTTDDAGTVTKAGLNTVFDLQSVDVLDINAADGSDTFSVVATAGSDVIDVDAATVDVNGLLPVDYANFEALNVFGRTSSDTFNVTSTAILDIFIDGGDPIGPVGDTLNITADTSSLFVAGPESDEGGFILDGNERVSYDHIEAVSVTDSVLPGDLDVTVCGTNGDDDITVIGTGTNSYTVSVNDGPAVAYIGSTDLRIEGKSGDDDIDVDVNDLQLDTFEVDGGMPPAGSDTLTVTGNTGVADGAIWTPSGVDSGTLDLSNLGQVIDVTTMEHVIYDGETENETLTVEGDDYGGNVRFVHTPGANRDSGDVAIQDGDYGGNSLLGISYEDLGFNGTVNFDAANAYGGATLVARGTASTDAFLVDEPNGDIFLFREIGRHVTLTTVDIQELVLDGLDSDDLFTIQINNPYDTINVLGGSPGDSDVLRVEDEYGGDRFEVNPGDEPGVGNIDIDFDTLDINYVGIEHIELDASDDYGGYGGGVDRLIVNDSGDYGGGGDNLWDVKDGPIGDLIQFDNRESIDYNDFVTVELVNRGGNDVFRVHPTEMSGFSGTFTVTGDVTDFDSLETIGTAHTDTTTSGPGGGPQGTITVNGVSIQFGTLETIKLVGLEQDDTFNVTPIGGVNTIVEAGGPTASDVMNVTVPDSARVTQGAESTSGTIDQTGAGDIDYFGVETINISSNNATVGADTLTVRGTDDNDTTEIQPVGGTGLNTGRIWTNDGAVVTFNPAGTNNNFTALTVLARFGDDTITVTPIANIPIAVSGGDPTGSDSVLVNGTTGTDTITFTPTPATDDAATVQVNALGLVTITTAESVHIVGRGGNDTLNVATPAATTSTVVLTPGSTVDAGSVQVDSLVPMTFNNLGATGRLTVTDPTAADGDRLIYNGTQASDVFTLPHGVVPAPSILLNSQIGVGTTAVENYTLRGLGGDDTFNIAPTPTGVAVRVEGDEPGASDVLNFGSVGATTVDLGASTIEDAAVAPTPNVTYSGIEIINVDSNTQNLTVIGTPVDDVIVVTPLGVNSGTLQANGVAPVVNFSETGTFTVDGTGGTDLLVVNGSQDSDTIAVNGSAVTVDPAGEPARETVNYTSFNSLQVNGLFGNDTFNVTPSSAVSMFIDGGDPIAPIGSVFVDTLNITADVSSVFAPGPEADEGGFVIDGNERVSYDHIEANSVMDSTQSPGPIAATVCGTNGDDDITLIGIAALTFTVSVNDGPAVLYIGAGTIDLIGKSGDDDIDVDLNVTTLGTTINVDGDLPTAGSDTLTVTGVDGVNDTPNWAPSATDAGTITVGANVINVIETEHLIYDGENDNETLTVNATAGDDIFIHTPVDRDAGVIAINTPAEAFLGIAYENLGTSGTVTLSAGAHTGADTLVAYGTDGNDTFNVSTAGVVDLRSYNGNHVDLIPSGLETLTLEGLDGDDTFNVTGSAAYPYSTTNLFGGNPSASDVVNLVGNNTPVTVTVAPMPPAAIDGTVVGGGLGLVNLSGDENLNLTPGAGANLATVQGGGGHDTLVVTSVNATTSQIQVNDVIPFITLLGIPSFTAGGGVGGEDLLNPVGTVTNDTFVVTATSVQVTDIGGNSPSPGGIGGPAGPIIFFDGAIDALYVDGLQGNDFITDTTTPAIPTTLAGGEGDDSIVGNGGREFITGDRGNDTLRGGGDIDTIYGGEGRDSIFGDTGGDNLHGGPDIDRFVWLAGDGNDTVDGGDDGADIAQFDGSAGADLFNIFGNLAAPTHVNVTLSPDLVDLHGIEEIQVNPLGAADTVVIGRVNDGDFGAGPQDTVVTSEPTATLSDLTASEVASISIDLSGPGRTAVDGAADRVLVDGRPLDDNLLISASNGRVKVAGLSYDVTIRMTDTTPAILDTLTVRGNEGNDTIKSVNTALVPGITQTPESLMAIILDGESGNDFISADAILVGGTGDDTIEGGAGPDQIFGQQGNDLMFGGNDGFNDTFDGGSEFDTILVHGTQPSADERIDFVQVDGGTLQYVITDASGAILFVSETELMAAGTVEEARIEAGAGADIIKVMTEDSLFDDPGLSVRITVVGGDDSTRDRLLVVDDNNNNVGGNGDDLTLYRKGESDSSGTVTIGPLNGEPFEVNFTGVEFTQFLDSDGVPLNSVGNGRLVVFKHDPNEFNDDRFIATFLGAGDTINVDPTIDPGFDAAQPFGLPPFTNFGLPGDQDWFRVVAETTGTLDFQVYFEEIPTLPSGRPGLPGNGNLDINVFDVDGTLVPATFGINNGPGEFNQDADPSEPGLTFLENERIRIPAVAGQTYYVRVFGSGANSAAINNYNMTIINEAPPVPYDIELDDLPLLQPFSPFEVCTQVNGLPAGEENSDSGRSQIDNVTCDRTPTIRFRIDSIVEAGGLVFLEDVQHNDGVVSFTNNPPDEIIRIPFNASQSFNPVGLAPGFRIAIFEEGQPQQPSSGAVPPRYGFPQEPLGFATPVAGAPGVFEFTFPALAELCPNPNGTLPAIATAGLCDGSHFISAKVQMIDVSTTLPTNAAQTGYGARSVSMEIVVDALDPNVVFGDPSQSEDGLDPASDSGVIPQSFTVSDDITSDTTPTFWGWAEANTVIRLWLDLNNDGLVTLIDANADGILDAGSDRQLAETVAVPQDGTNQFPNGYWVATSNVDMNDPSLGLARDGRRRILATAEDLAGNISPAQNLEIFIDTQGPQVTGVFYDPIDAAMPLVSVFNPKPYEHSPTPLTRTIRIDVRDLPARFAQVPAIGGGDGPSGFQHPALNSIVAVQPGNYQLTGDLNGIIEISSIIFFSVNTAAGVPATGFVEINFATPLPDDRYTLTMFDRIQDDAGNALDGESNTQEPTGTPVFPTGDGNPGDSFIARFTVDSRPEVGTFCCGSWYIDLNQNGSFDDPNNHDTDATNGDIVFKFGLPGDFPVVGDWDGDGFDEIGVYGRRGIDAIHPIAGFYFELDLNGNGTFDNVGAAGGDVAFPFNAVGIAMGAGGRPVAGAWNQNQLLPALPGQVLPNNLRHVDHVAVFNGTSWFVDLTTAPYTPTSAPPETEFVTPVDGRPIAADFNGDGDDDIGHYRSTTNTFTLDVTSDDDFVADTTLTFGFNTVNQWPVAADFDADRDGNIGLFVTDRNGMFPREAAEWYLDLGRPFTGPLSGPLSAIFGGPGVQPANPGDELFQPPPTGGLPGAPNLPYVFQDIFYQFGDEMSEPIVGNFDPPASDAPVINPVIRPLVRVDHANTASPDATPIFVWDGAGAATESGSIEVAGDVDVFRFTADKNGRVTIDVAKDNSNVMPTLSVVAPTATTGKRPKRAKAPKTAVGHAEVNVVAGQTYYFQVSGFRGSVGSYALEVDHVLAGATPVVVPGGTTGDDHGNTAATGTRLNLTAGTQTRSGGSIGAVSDLDYFTFTATGSGRLDLNVAAVSRGLNTALDVFDSNGVLIATNDNAHAKTTNSRVTIDVVAGQSYSFRVRELSARRGDYSVALDLLLAGGI